MIRADFHVHTTYCDGADSMRDMVLSAIEQNMEAIGFSGHGYTAFDESYCIQKEKIEAYKAEIRALREEFGDKIRILCGVEQDVYAGAPADGFDYAIGSVHYLEKDGVYYPVDNDLPSFMKLIKAYGNDVYAAIEAYFETVSRLGETVRPTIFGHFDLCSKFNEKNTLFDPCHPRYIRAWKKALDILLPYNIPFEVNTGAISRGYKTVPYPSKEQLLYIRDGGGSVVLSSDAHSRETLCFQFAIWEKELRAQNIPILTL